MSQSIMLVHEIKPRAAAKMHVKSYPGVEDCHYGCPDAQIATQVEADRISAAPQNIPRS